jgi:clan AA aspartic protease
MAITFVNVKVSNPAKPKQAAIFELLVDSGAIYSVLPAKELKKLGIKAVREKEFILADGKTVTMGVGNAFFEFQGEVGAAPVILGEDGVYLLGATALESIGLMLDPLRRELKPAPMLLMTMRPVEPGRERAMRKVLGRYIVMDSEICHGQLTFRGTRIMVKQILEQVARGTPWDVIVEHWGGKIKKAAIGEAVRLANEALFEGLNELVAELSTK